MRRHPPHHLSPARANRPAGLEPKPTSAAPSHHSNAPIEPEGQSILSKKIAHPEAILSAVFIPSSPPPKLCYFRRKSNPPAFVVTSPGFGPPLREVGTERGKSSGFVGFVS